MLKLDKSSKFKHDLKRCAKRNYDISLLNDVINTLRIPASLPYKNKDHELSGNFNKLKECHITPDWLLIYRVDNNILYLERTGTHADLFGL